MDNLIVTIENNVESDGSEIMESPMNISNHNNDNIIIKEDNTQLKVPNSMVGEEMNVSNDTTVEVSTKVL